MSLWVEDVNPQTVVFSHGKESGPWGTKIQSMAETCRALGAQVISVDYQGIDRVEQRVEMLTDTLHPLSSEVILVGSSMGGYVSAAVATRQQVCGAFLLAPAFFMAGYPDIERPLCPIEIVHGWHDDVVPVDHSIRFARGNGATLHLVDGDHRLMESLDRINALLRSFIKRLPHRRVS